MKIKTKKISISFLTIAMYIIFSVVELTLNHYTFNHLIIIFLELLALLNISIYDYYGKGFYLNIIFNFILCIGLAILDYSDKFAMILIFISLYEILDRVQNFVLKIALIFFNAVIYILMTCFDPIQLNFIINRIWTNSLMYLFIFMLLLYINQYKNKYDDLERMNRYIQECTLKDIEINTLKRQKQISQIIHDSVGNKLVALIMYIHLLDESVAKENENFKKDFLDVEKLADELLFELRKEVNEINNMEFDIDFSSSLEGLFERYKLFSIISIEYEMELNEKDLLPDQKYYLFCLIRESLTNSVYHGKASKLFIKIYYEKPNVKIYIKDNGLGCHHLKESYGLKGIQNQVEKLGGKVSFMSKQGFETVSEFKLSKH